MDELNSLKYMDWVVRETMRLYAPVPSTVRMATKDDVSLFFFASAFEWIAALIVR